MQTLAALSEPMQRALASIAAELKASTCPHTHKISVTERGATTHYCRHCTAQLLYTND